MLRLLIISDFTEAFPAKLLKGIINYSRQKEQWTICRMPREFKKSLGIPGVVEWAKNWCADAVIGQFEQSDDVELFAKNGIVAIAQDYKKRFTNIPNITGDYYGTGKMAAKFFIERGFKNFGFFGFNNVCWSDERLEGFRQEITRAGLGENFFVYNLQELDNLWFYQRQKVAEWLRNIPKPIGIMASDDNQGNNLTAACQVVGIKVPEEIAIIGVDNDELLCDLSSTPLSSIQVDIEDGGYRVAELIEKMVRYPGSQSYDVVLKPLKIVSRISTASYATGDVQIQKAIQFIHHNYMKKISVDDVLKEVPLSRRLLERRFKAVTNKSIYTYISDMRIKRFAEMLIETDDQIVNIALILGETDTKSIARRFKQINGCSPSQWREKHKKQ
ncbi:MAG: substrate-binding domain-containing protein [Bacteroidales bacterium]|nr:substrate-binding domain-containing protein [Bacteroidales bacterium]